MNLLGEHTKLGHMGKYHVGKTIIYTPRKNKVKTV